jgi:hypothetical protein
MDDRKSRDICAIIAGLIFADGYELAVSEHEIDSRLQAALQR